MSSDGEKTLFDLPTDPEEFGVVIPPPALRKIDFSALDYSTGFRAIIEYIKTYWPNEFNDFVVSSGAMMFADLIAANGAKLSLRGDILAGESFLPSAQTEPAVANHLALINQRIKRQTPAVADVEVTTDFPIYSDINVPAGVVFSVHGRDNQPVYYELYRAPNDFINSVVIPAGKRGVVVYGLEGRFASPENFTSAGGPNQLYRLGDDNLLDYPIFVTVFSGAVGTRWSVVSEPIESFGPTDKVVEISFLDSGASLRFGDDKTGMSPLSGQQIEVRYRTGGGARGRIGAGQIDESRQVLPQAPSNAAVSVRFRNPAPSVGGTDKESLEAAKRRAPKDFALRTGVVTAEDYAQVAQSFAHPAFGSVSKAIATIRTGLNANLIEIYCLAEGPDGIPVTPNAGLKAGLKTRYGQLNVLTDHVEILDGQLRPVDVELTVAVSANVDASVVKSKVEQAITDFFREDSWELGQPLYTSVLESTIKNIDGVAYVDMFLPADNILPADGSGTAGTDSQDVIAFNELIVEGRRTVQYFYEKPR